MKKIIGSIFILSTLLVGKSFGQMYQADTARVSFFSKTAAENIDANNTLCKPLMVLSTGEIVFSLINESFDFPKPLMKEHFNEDYMESAKYPKTTFDGFIKGANGAAVDYLSDGTYNVTVTGTMDMHGVKKQITVPGTVTVKGNAIFIYAKFNIKIADYNIKLPSVVTYNIADNVDVTVTATMKPYKK